MSGGRAEECEVAVSLGSGTDTKERVEEWGANRNRLSRVPLHQRAGFTPAQAGREPPQVVPSQMEDVLVGKSVRSPQKPEERNIALGLR